MSPAKLNPSLLGSELFAADSDLAVRLWNEGFRPRPAEDLEPWDRVAHRATVFGFPVEDRIRSTEVVDVERREGSPGSVWIKLDDDAGVGWVETDELAEVWAK